MHLPYRLVVVAALMVFATHLYSQGTTVTIGFDGPPTQFPGGGTTNVANYLEAGMSFTPIAPDPYFVRRWPFTGLDAYDGTTYLWTGRPGQSLMFSFTNAAVFSMISVDLAEFGAFTSPATVGFLGYRHDGSVVSTNFTTDGIADNTGPLQDFQTFFLGPQFSNLDRVEVPGYGWSLDNLVVSIPEPGGYRFLAIAAALAGARLLRRRG